MISFDSLRSTVLRGMWMPCLLLVMTLEPTGARAQAPPVDPLGAVVQWRQVGWMANQNHPCPHPVGSWAAPSQWDVGGERFCIYRFPSGSVSPQDLFLLQGQAVFDEVGPDRMAVAPMGGVLDDVLLEQQSAWFLDQAGHVALPRQPTLGPVSLAVLDTQPSGLPVDSDIEENSVHGKSLRAFAHRLGCSAPPCPVVTQARLALAYTAFDSNDATASVRDEVHGGVIGTIAELGETILATIEAGPPVGAVHQVFNLSVAWDGALMGGLERGANGVFDPTMMPVDVRLVFRALEHAAQAGAVVVAAAGNRADHRQMTGALLPAAWEQVQAPDMAGGYRPLIYAVAGVDAAGQPLANRQPGSQAPMAAYGDHAVLDPDDIANPTARLTGSSVAALVVSASAAAAWHYAPWLDAGQLMDEVYRSGDVLSDLDIDVCLPHPAAPPCAEARPVVRRISVCRAVERVCWLSGTCPPPFDPGSPSPCPIWHGVAPDLGAIDLSAFEPAGVSLVADLVPVPPGPAPCDETVFRDADAPTATDPCPSFQYNGLGAEAWVHTQPGSTPCPNCPLVRGSLSIEIGEHFVGIVRSPTLVACGTALSLPVPDLGTDLPMTHQVDGIELPPDCASGLLTFTWVNPEGEDASTVSPISISP